MPIKAYARRYAQAVFEIALEKKELERWQSDLQRIAETVSDATVLSALENPKLKFNDKIRLFSENLSDINPLVLNLVRMLIARSRIGIIGAITDEYQDLLNSYQGIKKAQVITAVPLDEKDEEKLAENLGSMVGSRVILKSEVDPEILGGIIARVGGKLLDGSTRSKLAALKRQLSGT